jgi:DNA-binding XRE family transcriptional regulator
MQAPLPFGHPLGNSSVARAARRARRRASDPSLHRLVRELLLARVRSGMTQQEVAARMRTTKSAISRLEGGIKSRPTLTTLENYALVVGCCVEIHLRPWP